MTGKTRKEQLEAMLAEDPADPFLRYGLAMEHISAGDDATASQCLSALVEATPDYVPAYLQAGQALIRLGRVAQAREVLEKGIVAARRKGETHAADEMQGFLEGLE